MFEDFVALGINVVALFEWREIALLLGEVAFGVV